MFKKILILSFLLISMVFDTLYATKLATLYQLEVPTRIMVKKGILLVSDHKIKLHMYTIKDFSYKLLANRGQGPGEIFAPPFFSVLENGFYVFFIGWKM